MEYSNIILESHDQYATITLNRPGKLNAINYDLLLELGRAIDEINEMIEVRVVVGRSRYAAEKNLKPLYTPKFAQSRAHFKRRIPWNKLNKNDLMRFINDIFVY